MADKNSNLVWLDLEMTGLNPNVDVIIEIATIVTDSDLNIIASGPVFAIAQDEEYLAQMDDWNQKTHGNSGLIERVRQSETTCAQAERETIQFLRQHVSAGKSPLCGNSICQDRRFLYKYMPDLCGFFHYRNLDVSTLKELAKRWMPKVYDGFHKDSQHVALEDIKDSIDELKYYREHFIRPLKA